MEIIGKAPTDPERMLGPHTLLTVSATSWP